MSTINRPQTRSLLLLYATVLAACLTGCEVNVQQNEDATRDGAPAEHLTTVELDNFQTRVVIITPSAAAKFHEFLADSPTSHICVALKEGGYSGLMYDLQIEDPPIDPNYLIDRSNGFTLVISPEHAKYLTGATIDWKNQPDGSSGFEFHIPNATEHEQGE